MNRYSHGSTSSEKCSDAPAPPGPTSSKAYAKNVIQRGTLTEVIVIVLSELILDVAKLRAPCSVSAKYLPARLGPEPSASFVFAYRGFNPVLQLGSADL
jgi:hypothetical protein